MDSILELDPAEIRYLKETLKQSQELLVQRSAQLFEDAFNLLLTHTAKVENFHLLKEISSGSEQSGPLSDLLNAILSICSSVFRVNLKGNEEFVLVLNDLGLKA